MDGEPPQEEDFSQIPLVERSQHKNWKARVSAYTEVIAKSAKTASDSDPFFRPYTSDGSLLKKWCLDANAVAQEKGIEAVLAIVQNSGETSSRTRSDVVPGLVDKALGAARAGTKRKGTDLCLMYVEVENAGDGVVADVLVGLESKQPKVVAGSISCLKEIIESFGVTGTGNVKPILKALAKIFAHSDKNVRAEGTALTTALYRYLGPALIPALADLKPVQMAELQKSFDAMDADGQGAGSGKPTRWTRKAQKEREAAEASGGGDEGSAEVEEESAPIDPLSLLEPVDVIAKFPPDLMDMLGSAKWKERLETLTECNKVLTAPGNARISDSNVDACGALVQTLGTKCKSDANVMVVMEAAKALEGLARGMGKAFGRYRGVVMSSMLERLKERKANVVEALGKALDAVFTTTTLGDILEDVLPSLKSKNPQVKEGTLKFLHRSLQTTADAPPKDQVKPLAETLVALLGDSVEPVRSSAAECLGTMMKILGERAFNPYVENVGELQMAKVKDAFAKAEIKYRVGGAKASSAGPVKKVAPAPRPPVASSSSIPSSPPIKASGKANAELLEEFAPPPKAPPARFARPAPKLAPSSPSKPALEKKKSAPAAKPAPSAKAGPSKSLASSPSEPIKYRFSPEEAAAKASELIPGDYHAKLSDAAWKTRLEAAEEMVKWVEEEGANKVDSEVLMRFLGKTPGWGEKNFQVSAKVYQVMQLVAERSPTFGKPAASLSIGPLTDKLGDMKLKKPAGDALTAFAEKTSLAFVLTQGYDPMGKQKAPKAQADALVWIKQQLNDFGIAGIPLRELISFVKTALGSPNAAVRSSATQVLVTVKIFVGGDISGFIEDLNPQLLSTINSEFEKAASQTAPEPTRTQADLQEVAASAGKGKAGGADPLDDLIPRVDLDKLVSSTSVVADSRSDAWKVRKEAFEALNSVLDVKSNSRLKPNMGEIGTVLKKAMADTNLTVKMTALNIITKIATGMGQPFEKHNKLLTPAVASVCADQKATTRTAALNTLSAMADASGGLDSMYTGLATSLESPNPALRSSVLGWLGERLQADPPAKSADLSPLAGPVISCLEDRNGDVRKGATSVLPFVVASAGYEYVMDQTANLKPASKSTIIPLIEKARANAPAEPASAPVKPVPAAVAKVAKAPPPRSAPSSPAPAAAPVRSIGAPVRSLAMKALSSAPASRPMSGAVDSRPTGLPKARTTRPASALSSHTASSIPSSSSSSRQIPFLSDAPEPRGMRLKKDATRWLLEASPKGDLTDYLSIQMEHHALPELFSQLFSKDHRAEEDFMAALTTLADFYDSGAAATFSMREEELHGFQMANVDLALKYSALKLLSNNTQMANRCLEVITNVIETISKCNERFSDAEAKLFVPALIYKLGDAKFGIKLVPIIESLDKIIAGSQVVQLLVQYGLEDKSAGKTCKNESLQLIEKAYRKRGSILRTKDDRSFYETVARCIADSGTRNAALSVMALLQIQGGSTSLAAVVDAMPQSSKDMLANRRATMATARGVARVSEPEVNSPARPTRPMSAATPRAGPSGSPAKSTRKLDSPATRLPKSATASPSTTRTTATAFPRAGTSLQTRLKPVDQAPKPSMMPLARGQASRPAESNDSITAAINAIRQEDPVRSVDALKQIQSMLSATPEAFFDNVQTIVDTLMDEMDRAFTPPENLRDPQIFRLVKHLIQSFSGISSNPELMRRLSYDDVYSLLSGLSFRLVQADRIGGHVADLSKFINLIVIQTLATPDRLLVFKAMFRLLGDLTKDFAINRTKPDEEIAAHADLVLKCLWKRCKILDDDLKSGRLNPGKLLGVLEEFMERVSPTEWRRRANEGIAMADLPLRTVKTIIQRTIVYAKETDQEIYDILLGEFGDRAADTVVYPYIFRLAGTDTARSTSPALNANGHGRSGSHAVEQDENRPISAASRRSAEEKDKDKKETEPERLVRALTTGNQSQGLDVLYAYVKANPEQEGEIQTAISTLPSAVQTYVRRMLESRRAAENPSPTRPHAALSPTRPISLQPLPSTITATATAPSTTTGQIRRGPRPSSLAVDKTAPAEDQLAQLKNVFQRATLGASQGLGGAGSVTSVTVSDKGSPGEPLSEIDAQSRM